MRGMQLQRQFISDRNAVCLFCLFLLSEANLLLAAYASVKVVENEANIDGCALLPISPGGYQISLA